MPRDADVKSEFSLLLEETRVQTAWLRLLGLQALFSVLAEVLETDKQRAVYRLSDGRSVREVAADAGVSVGTVSRLWTEWAALGVVRPTASQAGRWEHLAPVSMGGDSPPAG
jgi:hypothetical protein